MDEKLKIWIYIFYLTFFLNFVFCLCTVNKAGGNAFPCIVDIRSEEQILKAVKQTVSRFGGIDILVNNASAISLTGTLATSMKKYDLMNSINARGTYLWFVPTIIFLAYSYFLFLVTNKSSTEIFHNILLHKPFYLILKCIFVVFFFPSKFYSVYLYGFFCVFHCFFFFVASFRN